MESLDWVIIIVYLLGMIGLSMYLGRTQRNHEDYYVAGRNLPWYAVGISTMATQTSNNSFVGIPAFVALRDGGGLTWLQYELALPLAIIAVLLFLLPFFRRLQLVSLYEYLEMRFDVATRMLLSFVFLISRGLATATGLYAAAIVLSVSLGLGMFETIILIGIAVIIYDTLGGISAVVWSDVIQMIVLVGGLFVCVWYAIGEVGTVSGVFDSFPDERWQAVDMAWGLADGSDTAFWGFLIGGFFLYMSYYGVDQSQVQREFSSKSVEHTRKSLLFNGLARFPLTVLYVLLGIAVFAVFIQDPELQAAVLQHEDPNFLVPEYIRMHLPVGLRAILFAAILAAAMSSLDSGLNSISAVTVRDYIERFFRTTPRQNLWLGKITTVIWGGIIILFAQMISQAAQFRTVVEIVNQIGSAFYGPILAAFLAGVLSKRATGPGVIAGVVLGVGFNMILWLFFSAEVFWMWWNLAGLVVAVVVTLGVSRLTRPPSEEILNRFTLAGSGAWRHERTHLPTYVTLIVYFVLIVAFTFMITVLFG